MESPRYERQGNTLRIAGQLDLRDDARFGAEVRALVDEAENGDGPSVVIDLLGATSLGTHHLSDIVKAAEQLDDSGRTLILRVDGATASLFRSCGVDKIVGLDIR